MSQLEYHDLRIGQGLFATCIDLGCCDTTHTYGTVYVVICPVKGTCSATPNNDITASWLACFFDCMAEQQLQTAEREICPLFIQMMNMESMLVIFLPGQ